MRARHGLVAGVIAASAFVGLWLLAGPAMAATTPVGGGPFASTVDPGTGTIYVVNSAGDSVSVLDAATCTISSPSGCHPVASVPVGDEPRGIAIDETTHTVFVTNFASGDVSVVDAATCNATHTGGCDAPIAVFATINSPFGVAVNEDTQTVYVTDYLFPDTISLFDGARCHAGDTSGCALSADFVHVQSSPATLAVDPATNTLYVGLRNANVIDVIDGSSCQAADSSGCAAALVASVPVGSGTIAVGLDQATHTLYAAQLDIDRVSVIDAGRCNAADTSGCGATAASVSVGDQPEGLAVNSTYGAVYVADASGDTLSVINSTRCNATDTSGCSSAPVEIPVGKQPDAVTVEPASNAVYVANFADDSETILFPPEITSADHARFRVGTAGTFSITDTGTPTPVLSENGALPTGLHFDAATGDLSGTPAVGAAGTYHLTLTAANSIVPNASQRFTVFVAAPAASSSPPQPAPTTGPPQPAPTTGPPSPASPPLAATGSGVATIGTVGCLLLAAGTVLTTRAHRRRGAHR